MKTLAILALLVAHNVAAQGLYWESTTEFTGMEGRARHSKIYYMPKMYKETSDFGNEISLIRLDKELFITINTKEKTYTELTFGEMEEMLKHAGSAYSEKLAAMREKLKSMPEEQRKMVERMMGAAGGGAASGGEGVTVVEGSKKQTINGFVCTQYIVKQGEATLATLWTTKEIPGFEKIGAEIGQLKMRIAATIPRSGEALAEGYKKIDGFPVRTEMSMLTRTVTKVEQRSTPASEFEVPAGYKKVKSRLVELNEKMKDHE